MCSLDLTERYGHQKDLWDLFSIKETAEEKGRKEGIEIGREEGREIGREEGIEIGCKKSGKLSGKKSGLFSEKFSGFQSESTVAVVDDADGKNNRLIAILKKL